MTYKKVNIDYKVDRAYYRAVLRAYLIFILLFWCQLAAAFDPADYTLLGVEFPVLQDPFRHPGTRSIPYSKRPLRFDLVFYLSKTGVVDSFHYSPSDKKDYMDVMAPWLRTLEFYPGAINDTFVPFALPAELVIESKFASRFVVLHLPYDEYTCQRKRDLLEKALILNGVTPPGVRRFPPYFCRFSEDENIDDYAYAVYRIELDDQGNMLDFRELFSSREIFSDLMSRVLLHVNYRGGAYLGRGFASEFYLIIRFFNIVGYPTCDWPPAKERGITLPYDFLRIETRLYLESIIHPPIPVNVPSGSFSYGKPAPSSDSIEVYVKIDSSGNISRARFLAPVDDELGRYARNLLEDLAFTPARNLEGERKSFHGELIMVFDASKRIRIAARWLPLEAQTVVQ
jgi:hypothetical protein